MELAQAGAETVGGGRQVVGITRPVGARVFRGFLAPQRYEDVEHAADDRAHVGGGADAAGGDLVAVRANDEEPVR